LKNIILEKKLNLKIVAKPKVLMTSKLVSVKKVSNINFQIYDKIYYTSNDI